ncbi:hypothetical protein HPB52_010976 [Rhipicephalus sanguineus]|uniref:Transcriptional adapter 2-alpha/beta-like domain-containing protein n=1 Tax=Rhipicephalus sanguineus TaxID=34632 RepID=A0A9D4SX16_RHISA|nr:hypothetical protein HPB52_010976 [Rhipicephalus sanguineus]
MSKDNSTGFITNAWNLSFKTTQSTCLEVIGGSVVTKCFMRITLLGDPPRPLLCSQQQADMAGYMAARGDFAHEFDNFAEMDVAELDFRHCEDTLDKGLLFQHYC